MSAVPDAASRRAALLAAKLGALVRDQLGESAQTSQIGEVAGFGTGAGVVVDDAAWVLLDERPAQGLGAALAWALRRGASRVQVLADAGTGVLARRAEMFDLPIEVLHIEGRSLLPAIVEPLPELAAIPDRHLELPELIEAGGAVPVEEHGVLVGEVLGLEVCRVVDDPQTGETRLEVGVGAHDRETFQMLHGDRPKVEALADVVGAVTAHRSVGAAQHPLNLLAASRLLRARLIERPELIGAESVVAVQPPLPRPNVKDPIPCVASATIRRTDEARAAVLVVCTTGIDLDVVPYAADALLRHPAEQCWIAAPARDVVDIQSTLAGHLRVPTRFVPVDVR